MGMDKFFTRDSANKGTKVPLYLPTGELTEDWLLVLGMESDAARIAMNRISRSTSDIIGLTDEKEIADTSFATKAEAASLLISDWSFEEECNEANKIKLLTNAPHLVNAIDAISSNRKLFFVEQSANSVTSQSKSSSSTVE